MLGHATAELDFVEIYSRPAWVYFAQLPGSQTKPIDSVRLFRNVQNTIENLVMTHDCTYFQPQICNGLFSFADQGRNDYDFWMHIIITSYHSIFESILSNCSQTICLDVFTMSVNLYLGWQPSEICIKYNTLSWAVRTMSAYKSTHLPGRRTIPSWRNRPSPRNWHLIWIVGGNIVVRRGLILLLSHC